MTDTNRGRQTVLSLVQRITFADLKAGVLAIAPAIQPGAIVVGGGLLVSTPLAGATAGTLMSGVAADTDALHAAVDLKVAGYTELTKGKFFPVEDKLVLTGALTGTATAGEFELVVNYVVVDRVNEVYV